MYLLRQTEIGMSCPQLRGYNGLGFQRILKDFFFIKNLVVFNQDF